MTVAAQPQLAERSIVEQVAAAQRSRRLRFRLIFAAVWISLVLGLGITFWIAGRVSWEFIVRSGPLIVLQGAGITVLLSVVSICFATVLAALGAIGRLSSNPVANGVASLYVSLIRGTPLLVQIYFIYFALPQVDIVLPSIPAGIVALSLNYGAYMTEIFRAGIQAVPRSQREAAEALGMPERLVQRRIIFPQAFRIVIPAIGNDFIAMLKDSALVSTISVHETLFLAQRVGRSELQPIPALFIAALVYWALTIIFSFFQERLERRMARGDR